MGRVDLERDVKEHMDVMKPGGRWIAGSSHSIVNDISYGSLARFDLAFSYPSEYDSMMLLGVGGSRTTPGRFGAKASGIMKSLATKDYHKEVRLSADERRRLTLWLDLNSSEIGWIGNDRRQIAEQKRGVAIWPSIDMDPTNPVGVERDYEP